MSTIQSIQIKCCLSPQQPSSRFLLSDIRFLRSRVATASAGTTHRLRPFMFNIVVIFLKTTSWSLPAHPAPCHVTLCRHHMRCKCDKSVLRHDPLIKRPENTASCVPPNFFCNKCFFLSPYVFPLGKFFYSQFQFVQFHTERETHTHTDTHTQTQRPDLPPRTPPRCHDVPVSQCYSKTNGIIIKKLLVLTSHPPPNHPPPPVLKARPPRT